MEKLLQTLIIGLVYGSLYALIAMGIVLLYRTTGVLNIAHGGVGVFAGFIAWDLNSLQGWPYFPALALGVLVAIIIGLAFEFLVVRRVHSPALATVATLGLFLVLQGFVFIPRRWGSTWGQAFISPVANRQVRIPGAAYSVSYDQIILVVHVMLFFGGIYFMLRRTRLGLAMRAVSDDAVAARLMGIRQRLVAPVVWALAFGLSGLTTMLLAPITFLDNLSLTALTLKSIAVAFVGGLVSLPLTVAGAMLLALLEAGTDLYAPRIEGLPQAWPFILMLIVLLARFSRGTKTLEDTAVAGA
ncbi:MAG: branched-chain amino acid ABC transporter permease [Acidimicrobiia bacterium]